MRFRYVFASTGPPLFEQGTALALPLPQNTWANPLVGFSVNARIQPRGRACTWRVEYGTTTAYGSTTSDRALPGKLTAVYSEDWTAGTNGWQAGRDALRLSHQVSEGGFVRENVSLDSHDYNHTDGVGVIHLGPYGFVGRLDTEFGPRLVLGGGKPDLRGAQLEYRVRGIDYAGFGTNVCPWIQMNLVSSTVNPLYAPNWAATSQNIASKLASGLWENAALTLRNAVAQWTFAGRNSSDGRIEYQYGELDMCLSAVDLDIFIAQLVGISTVNPPSGNIDFANLVLRYRNHNVCAPSNGGTLVSFPAGGTDPSVLTDGHRIGATHTWQGAAGAPLPLEFVYSFANPITLESVVIQNDPVNPSLGVNVRVSSDGGATWTSIGSKDLPATNVRGSNYLFGYWFASDGVNYTPVHATPINRMSVRILTLPASGTRAGLASIEAYGTGATEQTDNAWYDVNRDVPAAVGTWNYRVVATTDKGTVYGPNQTVVVTVPPPPPPEVLLTDVRSVLLTDTGAALTV
ncbi:MAG TPA: hypothetical protein VNJ04_05120 [Gemmatimonadaceae bacterium]|nr:hypothetical protein [Gemmatimonadaceae bacterium]